MGAEKRHVIRDLVERGNADAQRGVMHVVGHFVPDVDSAGLARRFVEATLAAWDLDDLNDVACLLTSELASNAVRHAGTAFWVTMDLDLSELRVEVADLAPLLPVPGEFRNDPRSGRGLLMVEALA